MFPRQIYRKSQIRCSHNTLALMLQMLIFTKLKQILQLATARPAFGASLQRRFELHTLQTG